MLDADADIGRRAWIPCEGCAPSPWCAACRDGRNCERHWTYMLASAARWLFLQCRTCHRRWWHDTGFGVGDRPAGLDEPLPPAAGL